MPILFFDTETTGFVEFKLPSSHPDQPHLVQIAAILDDDEGNTIETLDSIILPEGFTEIPKAATAVHKITIARALEEGKPLKECMRAFHRLIHVATLLVAHNINFDRKVVKASYFRVDAGGHFPEKLEKYCTMLKSTKICKIPGRFNNYKWPTLDEAYRILVDKNGFEDAHNALVDTQACRKIYYAIQEL